MICPKCSEKKRDCECAVPNNLVPESARPTRAEFASTDWVECVARAVERTKADVLRPQWDSQNRAREVIAEALDSLVENLRAEIETHSTAEMSHSAGSGAIKAPKGN